MARAVGPNFAGDVKAKIPILVAGAFVLILLLDSAAQAQCTAVGPLASSPSSPTVAMEVAGVSASVGALVSSVYSANTAFLNQLNAFIGSPDNPQPDQQVPTCGPAALAATSVPARTQQPESCGNEDPRTGTDAYN